LHFPAHQRPDTDHAWNNLIFTWTAQQGAYSLVWNAVRLYADKGYGQGRQLEMQAWVTLGDAVPKVDKEKEMAVGNAARFVGSITRVNLVFTRNILSFKSGFSGTEC